MLFQLLDDTEWTYILALNTEGTKLISMLKSIIATFQPALAKANVVICKQSQVSRGIFSSVISCAHSKFVVSKGLDVRRHHTMN